MPRHEEPRSHHQVEIPESRGTGQVLQRNPLATTNDERLELAALRLGQPRVEPAMPDNERDERRRVGIRRGHPRSGQPTRDLTSQAHTASADSNRDCMSASKQEVMTGSSSPASTWSRL